jgi:hypothetical protein
MTLEELEKRVQLLEDVYSIQNLKAKYCQLADDNYNPEETIKLFTEDGVWDGGQIFGTHRGKEAIKAFLTQAGKDVVFAVHYSMTPEITIEGNKANAKWYGLVPMNFQGQAFWTSVFYTDKLVKNNGKWYFKEVNVNVLFHSPYELGWANQRFPG